MQVHGFWEIHETSGTLIPISCCDQICWATAEKNNSYERDKHYNVIARN